ncbi:MAG: transcriptional regulator [Rhodospirillaceae bacterium]|nr:transcriptional regulator [Rhodospirillaceae bacterium]
MKHDPKKHDSDCMIAYGVDTFGDRWSLLVLRDMMLYGKRRYNEFLASNEQIATNVLATRLKHLECEGIISKERDPENRRSFVYSLTEKGVALAPVIIEIMRWSSSHMKVNARRRKLLDRIDNDREGILADIRNQTPIMPPPPPRAAL